MANRLGGYALADVLALFYAEGIWQTLGRDRTHEVVNKVIEIARRHASCAADILKDIGPALGLCPTCAKPSDEFVAGRCPRCYITWYNYPVPTGSE